MRSPISTTLRSSGMGSGWSETVLTMLSIWPADSTRISRERRARFSASHDSGWVNSLRASNTR